MLTVPCIGLAILSIPGISRLQQYIVSLRPLDPDLVY